MSGFWGFSRDCPVSQFPSHYDSPLFNPALHVTSYSDLFISCHPLPHTGLGSIVGLTHHRCIIILVDDEVGGTNTGVHHVLLYWTLSKHRLGQIGSGMAVHYSSASAQLSTDKMNPEVFFIVMMTVLPQ